MRKVAVLAFSYSDRVLRYLQSLKIDADILFLEKTDVPPPESKAETVPIISDLVGATAAGERKGYEAIVTWCHGDPAVREARGTVGIPVLGPGETSMHTAAMLGQKFSILVPSLAIKKWLYQNTVIYGFRNELASIRIVNFSVDELLGEWEESIKGNRDLVSIQMAVDECIRATEDDGASMIILGCGGMTWMEQPLSERLQEKNITVPLLNPLPFTVEFAKVLANLKLRRVNTDWRE